MQRLRQAGSVLDCEIRPVMIMMMRAMMRLVLMMVMMVMRLVLMMVFNDGNDDSFTSFYSWSPKMQVVQERMESLAS